MPRRPGRLQAQAQAGFPGGSRTALAAALSTRGSSPPDSESPDEIATLDFLDEATGLACSARGQLFCVDTRQPRAPLGAAAEAPIPAALGGQRWCAGVSRCPRGSAGDKPLVARLSAGGHVVLTDIRNAASPVQVAQCPVPTAGLQGGEFQSVSFAPLLSSCLAVSGFDATVQVYNTQSWGPSGRTAEPVFVHKGHLFGSTAPAGHPPLVTTHTWHPSKPRTVLSAATDGSLHVWGWSDPRGAS
ncbi:WD repeat-containing protein 73 [Varanus komodoensis]|nr:WD repeat-containing protein 73 [Varanus komodoensis]